jgi:2-polyprenyl-6-methoxyphenol hydroxylase-like FAD-dependent oxidoreductase
MMQKETPVLIVGGGVVGLSASLFLARQGIASCLVERHPSTTRLPRSRGVNGRTMELMRELKLDVAIQKAGSKLAPAVGIYSGASVREILVERGEGGWLLRRMRARGMKGQASKLSPTGPCRCTQEDLEPILLGAARERGVDVRFSTECTEHEQDADGVSAVVVDRNTGERSAIRARYLIAADGARSDIRERLGIARSGRDFASHQLNIYFHADLESLVRGREFSMCLVENDAVRGLVVSIDNATHWALHASYYPDRGERPDDFTTERCVELVRHAVGLPDLEVEIKGMSPWQSAVRIAEKYRVGRIFLAGDAAHAMPPWGGFGANTGIQDAHNLAWKLAAVLEGRADGRLLATYEAERLPVAWAVGNIAGSMNDERGLIKVKPALGAIWRMFKVLPYLTMGYGYASLAVALDRGPRPGPGTTELRGRPGTRAPHVWLERGGEKVSTLDLFGTSFTLLAGPDGGAWCEAAREAERVLSLEVRPFRVGVDLTGERAKFLSSYGLRSSGAALVRPDGIVAWRSRGRSSAARDELVKVLRTIVPQREASVA